MSIDDELKKAKNYMIKTVSSVNGTIVELTLDNVARVEAMIQNDSAYLKASNKDAKPEKYPRKQTDEFKYGGSTAYWAYQLKDVLIGGKEKSRDSYSFEEIIKNLVSAIDRENSTHLNADGQNGRQEISERIINNRENIVNWLKNPGDEYEIIRLISEKTSGERGRKNSSFASKFAHYAAFYLFKGEECQDNFSIYDSVLIQALPKYLSAYKISVDDYVENYANYQKAIDNIISCAEQEYGEKISRNGFDHLVWYYHKGIL